MKLRSTLGMLLVLTMLALSGSGETCALACGGCTMQHSCCQGACGAVDAHSVTGMRGCDQLVSSSGAVLRSAASCGMGLCMEQQTLPAVSVAGAAGYSHEPTVVAVRNLPPPTQGPQDLRSSGLARPRTSVVVRLQTNLRV